MFQYMITQESSPSLRQLKAFEHLIGYRLPDRYRQFVMEVNGGRPHPSLFRIADMPNNSIDQIQWFYGLNTELECYSLKWQFEIGKDSYCDGYIPIACTPGGDQLIMNVKSDKNNEVLFWNYYYGYDDKDRLYYVCRTFGDLLESLFEDHIEV